MMLHPQGSVSSSNSWTWCIYILPALERKCDLESILLSQGLSSIYPSNNIIGPQLSAGMRQGSAKDGRDRERVFLEELTFSPP